MKILTSDDDFKMKYNLAIFNSINVLRILLQIPYYFFLYFRATEKELPAKANLESVTVSIPEVTFVVPTGGAGNLTGKRSTSLANCLRMLAI